MIEKKDKSVRPMDEDMVLGGLLARSVSGGSNMTDCLTSEMLAEFVDGTLSQESRDRVIAHLTTCEKCYSVVSDTLTIHDELKKQSRARIKRYLYYSLPASLAAAAVLLIVFKTVQPAPEFTGASSRSMARQETPLKKKTPPKPEIASVPRSFTGELADKLTGNSNTAILAQIKETRHKPRSAFGFSSAMTPEKAVFNIGASLLDLEISLKEKDKEKIDVFAKKLVELLKPMESSYGLNPLIVERVNSGNDPGRYEGFSRAVEASFENTKEFVLLKFGAWVEAASLAAEAGNAAFFQPADAGRFKKDLENSGVPVGIMKDLTQLESIMASTDGKADQFKTMARLLADIKDMY